MRRILMHLGYILLLAAPWAWAAPKSAGKKIDKDEIRRTVIAGKTGWTSSGGEGWFCGDDVESLDLVEARVRDPQFKLFKPADGDPEEWLKAIVFNRWAKAFPEFARRFWAAYQKLPLSQWEDKALPKLDDRGRAELPERPGCVIRNLAVRYSLSFGPDNYPEVFVDYDRAAFLKMKTSHQVALMIHETIYTMARELGHMNSAGVRALSSWLLSERFIANSYTVKDGQVVVHPSALETMSTYLDGLGLLDWRLLFRASAADESERDELRAELQKGYVELRTLYRKALEHKNAEGESSLSVIEELDTKILAVRIGVAAGLSKEELAPVLKMVYDLFEKKTHLVYEGMLANFQTNHAFMFMVANDLRIRRAGVNPETLMHSEDVHKSVREACFVLQQRVVEAAADPARNQMTEAYDPKKYLGVDADLHIFKVPGAHKMIDRALEYCRMRP